MKSLPKVAIIGRPNVGKSTLFNRLIGRRVAIVDITPGVTRDRLYASVEWNRRVFELIDTAGILSEILESLDTEIQLQVKLAIREADLLLFVVDARDGPTAQEEELVETLRRTGKPVVLAVNKIDLRDTVPLAEFHRWGFDKVIGISAMRGNGTGDLLDLVVDSLPAQTGVEEKLPPDAVKVAIIGKPNVGKSSLVNRILGEERMVVSEVPGTTRDPVDTVIRYYGRPLVLIDTAGLRKKMKTAAGLDYYTLLRTVSAIEHCDVAVLMLESSEGPARQDIRIADLVIGSGKSLIIAVNKWDLIENKDSNTAANLEKELKKEYPHLEYVPVIFISALISQRLGRLLQLVVDVNDQRRNIIPEENLNAVLKLAQEQYHPPAAAGRRIHFHSCRQVNAAPPVFEIVTSEPADVQENYKRYLVHRFRENFPFPGTPIRLKFLKHREKRKRI